MQIWTPSADVRDEGDFHVRLNPAPTTGKPFAAVQLSEDHHTQLIVQSVADADRLIRAAIEAKRLLIEAAAATDGGA